MFKTLVQVFSFCLFSKWPDIFATLPLCPALDLNWLLRHCKTGKAEMDRWGILYFPYNVLSHQNFSRIYQFTVFSAPNAPWRGPPTAFWQLYQLTRWVWRRLVVLFPSHNLRIYGSRWHSQTWARLVITFLQPFQHKHLMFQVSCQHWDPSLSLCSHTQLLATASLNLGGWLPTCLVTEDQLWKLCHLVGCSYPFFREVWIQILGPLLPRGTQVPLLSVLSLSSGLPYRIPISLFFGHSLKLFYVKLPLL